MYLCKLVCRKCYIYYFYYLWHRLSLVLKFEQFTVRTVAVTTILMHNAFKKFQIVLV